MRRTNEPVTWNIDKYLDENFWNERKRWSDSVSQEWKETVKKANGLNNLSEEEKKKLFELKNKKNFVTKNKFKQGE